MQFFQSWEEIGRVLISAVVAYGSVVFFIRVAGKRATSKMNNFDWVITVAIGSLAGSMILFKDAVLVEGVVAVLALLILQYLTTKIAVFSSRFKHALSANATLLFYKGRFLEEHLKQERVLPEEVISAIRSEGYHDLDDVTAVILENNADLSVIGKTSVIDPALLEHVNGAAPFR